uniref:Uncharacterized protein n=1 Tax=Molossus molossus TaxID=27622 RepID=A0A7J8HGY2_MOLMO|nr:hypothetical protein HJG59_010937 [Molossus molossus]
MTVRTPRIPLVPPPRTTSLPLSPCLLPPSILCSPCLDLRVLLPRQPSPAVPTAVWLVAAHPPSCRDPCSSLRATSSSLLTTLRQFAQHRTASFAVTVQISLLQEKGCRVVSTCSTRGLRMQSFLSFC